MPRTSNHAVAGLSHFCGNGCQSASRLLCPDVQDSLRPCLLLASLCSCSCCCCCSSSLVLGTLPCTSYARYVANGLEVGQSCRLELRGRLMTGHQKSEPKISLCPPSCRLPADQFAACLMSSLITSLARWYTPKKAISFVRSSLLFFFLFSLFFSGMGPRCGSSVG